MTVQRGRSGAKGAGGAGSSGSASAIEALVGLPSVRMAAAVDPSGRVLAAAGFADGDVLEQISVLAVGLHAAGARIGKLTGGTASSGVVISSGASSVRLIPSPEPSAAALLVVVTQGVASAELQAGIDAFPWPKEAERGGALDDPEAFERSLLDSLERIFPSGKGRPDRAPSGT